MCMQAICEEDDALVVLDVGTKFEFIAMVGDEYVCCDTLGLYLNDDYFNVYPIENREHAVIVKENIPSAWDVKFYRIQKVSITANIEDI